MAANAAYRTNTAPARQPQRRPNQRPDLKPVKRPQKSADQIKREQHESFVKTIKVCMLAFTLVALFGAMLYGEVRLNTLQSETAKVQEQLKIAQSENVRINMENNSKISLDKVEEYAITKLGMIKRENNQAEYVELSKGEEAKVNASEATPEESAVSSSEKQSFLSYLFKK